MTTILFCAGAFILCLAAANRSLRYGLLAVLAVGYGYGILRANFPDTWTYLTFDAAVLGLYCGQLWRPLTTEQRRRAYDLRLWLVVLIAWPTLLFFLFPSDSPLVELVGLRANVFLLPFLLLGTRLSDEDVGWLALGLAGLNLAAVAVGVLEFFVGIERFYPVNEVTDIIYRSKDLVGWTAHRIPATFSSAHAFAGTLVMTLPLLIGAWVQSSRAAGWQRRLIGLAIMASLLGVFMAAARTHMIAAALLVAVVTFSGQLRGDQWVRWVVAVGLVGYVVSGEERLQRFTTLGDTAFIAERWTGSVNEGFFDALRTYPLGNGLAGGGTSVPYFLRGNQSPLAMENEYARIGIEQGLPGLTLWVIFLAWVFLRWPARDKDGWALGRFLGWVACAVFFFTGLTGVGLLSSVPQTGLMLITIGWFVADPAASRAAVSSPAIRPAPRRQSIPAVARQSVEPTGNR
ncbi:MAG: hypothetical protein H0W08_21905 [Acidobacteria bacterium]|nr:hypothetical protein [Acidobacteriota bacterium]